MASSTPELPFHKRYEGGFMVTLVEALTHCRSDADKELAKRALSLPQDPKIIEIRVNGDEHEFEGIRYSGSLLRPLVKLASHYLEDHQRNFATSAILCRPNITRETYIDKNGEHYDVYLCGKPPAAPNLSTSEKDKNTQHIDSDIEPSKGAPGPAAAEEKNLPTMDEKDQKKIWGKPLDVALNRALHNAALKGPSWTAVVSCSTPDVCSAVVERLNELHLNPNFASFLRSKDDVELIIAESKQSKGHEAVEGAHTKHVFCATPSFATLCMERINCDQMLLYGVNHYREFQNPASDPPIALTHCADLVRQVQLAISGADFAMDMGGDLHDDPAKFLEDLLDEELDNIDNIPIEQLLDYGKVEWNDEVGDFVLKEDAEA